MKRLALALALCLSFVGTIQSARPALAQDQQCESQPAFPTGWTVVHGTSSGGAVYAVSSTWAGSPAMVASVQIDYSAPRAFGVMSFNYLYFGFGDEFPITVVGTVLRGGIAQVTRTLSSNPLLSSGWTSNVTMDFGAARGDSILLTIYHESDGAHGSNNVAIQVNNVCGYFVVTPTPSVLPTMTATRTAAPSNTPAVTNTPSATPSPTLTATPTLTVTSGGPTVTPIVSTSTGLPTSTDGPTITSTLQGFVVGGDTFGTIQPPDQCSDVFNPCTGNLPFPVPVFATLNLPSPTLLVSNTAAPGFTTPTPNSPTSTPGGPTSSATFTSGQGASNGLSTQIAGIATGIEAPGGINVLGNSGPGVNGPDGTVLDFANGANQIGSQIGSFWGFVRGIQGMFLGRVGTLIAFLILVIAYILIVKILLFIVPLSLSLLRWLLRVIQAVKPI